MSCAGGVSDEPEAEVTSLAIRLPNTQARALYNREDVASFTVTIRSGTYTDTKTADGGDTIVFSAIPAGEYTITVYGKTVDGTIAASGSDTATVVEGEVASVTIMLDLLNHTDFSGTATEFLAHTFAPNTAATAYDVAITSATADEIKQIAKAIGLSSDPHYKGVYINLDLSGCGVTEFEIGNLAFFPPYKGEGLQTYLTGITLPSGTTRIGDGAFKECKALTSITIPSSVTSIGPSAFQSCEALTSVTIPSGVTSIKYGTFCDCRALTSVTIPSSVTCIEDSAFYQCTALASVSIPSNVTEFGALTFGNCVALRSVTIPSSVTQILASTFCGCNSTAITIDAPTGWTKYENNFATTTPDITLREEDLKGEETPHVFYRK